MEDNHLDDLMGREPVPSGASGSGPSQQASGEHSTLATPHTSTSSGDVASSRQVRLTIKCPSLERDPDVLVLEPEVTLREIKDRIHFAWPGKPRPEAMRCICSGKLISDDETVKYISALNRGASDSATIHIVVASNGWSGQSPASADSESQEEVDLNPANASSPSAPLTVAPGRHSRSDIHSGPSAPFRFQTPRTSSYRDVTATSDYFGPSSSRMPQPHFQSLHSEWKTSVPNTQQDDVARLVGLVSTFDEPQLSELRVLFAIVYRVYADRYAHQWTRTFQGPGDVNGAAGEMPQSSDRPLHDRSVQVLEDVLGWTRLPAPPENIAPTSALQRSRYSFFRKVLFDGRPYMLRSASANIDDEVQQYLTTLLERATRIATLDERLARVQALQSLQGSLSRLVSTAPTPTPTTNGPAASSEAAPASQHPATIASSLRPADIFAIMPSILFLSFKLSILVYVFTRNASPLKLGIVLTLAFAYLFYNAWELLIKQVRRRLSAAGVTLVIPGRRPSTRPTQAAPIATPRTDVPPSIDRPQHIYAPERFRTTNPLQGAWWLEQIAYLGMASEDTELGLLPASARPFPRSDGVVPEPDEHEIALARVRGRSTAIFKYAILPLVLFVGTLVPEIEMRRRSAIEEREHVIRVAASLEEERMARLEEAMREEEAKRGREQDASGDDNDSRHFPPSPRASSPSPSMSAYTSARAARPDLLRNEYSERVLRRRRDASSSGLAELQAERDEAALAEQQAREDAEELGAEDDLGFF